MSYSDAYFTGCLILFLFWLYIFLLRKDLRQEMLWASLWGTPFGFIDYFLIPTYWHPDSLFDLMNRYGIGIESFFFFFAMSGIASVLYEFLWKEKPVRMTHRGQHHFWLLFCIPLAFVFMSTIFPSRAIYNVMIVGAIGVTVTMYLRRDLWKQIIISAFIFSFFYLGVFVLVNVLFEGFVTYSYNLKNTWGILVLGIPLEELGVAFFAGAFWSTIYEYTIAYRERKLSR